MLTTEQVDQLFIFCRKRNVEYYDVQVELVDHLANAIEDKMAAQPTISFEEALKQVYKSFGSAGFAPLVKEKQKAARKYNNKVLWRLFKEQWRWPKFFVGSTIFAILYMVLQWENEAAVRILVISGVVIVTIAMMISGISLRRLQRKTGKKFLLVNIAGIGNLVFLPLNCFNLLNPWLSHSPEWMQNIDTIGSLLFCTIFTLYIVLAIASCQAVHHVGNVLKKSYPGVFAIV